MIGRIIVAILIGVVVWLLCVFGGALLVSLGIPVLKTLGSLLQDYAIIIGAVGGLLAFFTGWNPLGGRV
jgi:flagellar motor component MotA